MARYAKVQWEDNFVSLINLESVREPKKPILDYNEAEYIKATYAVQSEDIGKTWCVQPYGFPQNIMYPAVGTMMKCIYQWTIYLEF